MFADEVNNWYIRSPRRVYLVYRDKRVEYDVHAHFFFIIVQLGKKIPDLGKNYAFLDWEWGQNSAPQERAKILCFPTVFSKDFR